MLFCKDCHQPAGFSQAAQAAQEAGGPAPACVCTGRAARARARVPPKGVLHEATLAGRADAAGQSVRPAQAAQTQGRRTTPPLRPGCASRALHHAGPSSGTGLGRPRLQSARPRVYPRRSRQLPGRDHGSPGSQRTPPPPQPGLPRTVTRSVPGGHSPEIQVWAACGPRHAGECSSTTLCVGRKQPWSKACRRL